MSITANFYSRIFALCFIVLVGCDETDGLESGGNLPIGPSFDETLFTDTVTIETSLIETEVITSNRPWMLAGGVYDETIGQVDAGFYAEPALPNNTSYATNSNNSLSRIDLSLFYSYLFGDTTQAVTLKVYEIEEEIQAEQYTRNDTLSKGQLLGEYEFLPSREDDQLIQFSIRFSLGQRINAAAEDTLETREDLIEVFKGIYVTAEGANGGSPGFISGFEPTTGAANELKSTIDLVFFNGVDTTYQSLFIGRRFNHLDWKKDTGLLSNLTPGQSVSTAQLANEAFIQAGIGLTTRLRFPHLEDFAKKRQGNIIVNRAELLIGTRPEGIGGITTPPGEIYFAYADANGQLYEEDDTLTYLFSEPILGAGVPFTTDFVPNTEDRPNALSRTPPGGYGAAFTSYNRDARNYPTVQITNYVQEIIRDTVATNSPVDHGLILLPAYRHSLVNTLNFPDNNNAETPLKLLLYYTELPR